MQIYLITNHINGKIYIGQTRHDLAYYLYQQGWRARRNVCKKPALYAAIRKYNVENFSIRPLRKCKSVEEMNMWEKFYIQLLWTRDKKVGYNIVLGGEGTPGRAPWNKGLKNPYSEETLRKMGKAQHERMQRGEIPSLGLKWSDERRKQLSITMKLRGIKPSIEACRLGGKTTQGTV